MKKFFFEWILLLGFRLCHLGCSLTGTKEIWSKNGKCRMYKEDDHTFFVMYDD